MSPASLLWRLHKPPAAQEFRETPSCPRSAKWKSAEGEPKEAWIADYTDNKGRHIRTFKRKKDAEEFETTMRMEVAKTYLAKVTTLR